MELYVCLIDIDAASQVDSTGMEGGDALDPHNRKSGIGLNANLVAFGDELFVEAWQPTGTCLSCIKNSFWSMGRSFCGAGT